MCFSATASLIAGAGLSAAGVTALAVTRERRAMPFAAIPLLFGVQQAAEGAIWLAASGGDTALQGCASAAFLGFAEVLWPIYAPLAVLALEPAGWRRRAMWACFACGLLVAAAMLHGLVRDFTPGAPEGGHIRYVLAYWDDFRNAGLLEALLALYVAATCFSLMLSRHGAIRLFGVVVTAALAVTAFAYETWLFSVWCFFAAVLSVIVVVWAVRRRERVPARPVALRRSTLP